MNGMRRFWGAERLIKMLNVVTSLRVVRGKEESIVRDKPGGWMTGDGGACIEAPHDGGSVCILGGWVLMRVLLDIHTFKLINGFLFVNKELSNSG
jgi:hypothetical protein